YQSTQESNHFSQILVSQQVFICITADGCAFYSISHQTQPPFLLFSFACFFFLQNQCFRCFYQLFTYKKQAHGLLFIIFISI
ncbi:hypothetical protein MMP64_20030, partial [Acinetobacter sp. ANC 5659]|nr:hypothetical protein [Acinetobacter higginsii]